MLDRLKISKKPGDRMPCESLLDAAQPRAAVSREFNDSVKAAVTFAAVH